MAAEIDLIVPMKSPHVGKTRLRGHTAPHTRHADLVLALANDTLNAARATERVRSLLVVTTDPAMLTPLGERGAELLDEAGAGGLNPALCRAEQLLRARYPHSALGVLQADLPALRPQDLREALREADGERLFTADRYGTGTTLLLSAPGGPLWPRFGQNSARAHADSGARALTIPAPTLRCDVDTLADLAHARELGVGRHTLAILGTTSMVP